MACGIGPRTHLGLSEIGPRSLPFGAGSVGGSGRERGCERPPYLKIGSPPAPLCGGYRPGRAHPLGGAKDAGRNRKVRGCEMREGLTGGGRSAHTPSSFWVHRARPLVTIPATRRAEIIEQVNAGLARGTPLTIICESLQAQGSFAGQSLYNWLRADPEAKLAIEYARDLGHDWIAHECLEIADDTSNDVIATPEGLRPNTVAVLRAKVRIETRLKLLAKWGPKYSDDRTLRVEGEVNVNQRHTIDPGALDDSGRAALRHVIEQAQARGLLTAPEPVEAEFTEVEADGED